MQSYCAASIEMAFEVPVTTRSRLRQTLTECGFDYTTTARAARPGTLGLMPFQWQSGTQQQGSHARGGSLLLASVAARYVEGALSGSDAGCSLPDVSTGYCPGAVSCLISLSCQARAAGAKAALVEKDAASRGSGFSRGASGIPPGQASATQTPRATGVPQQIVESHHLALWAVAVALAGSESFPFDAASLRADTAAADADEAVPLPVRMPLPEAWLNLSAAAASMGLRDTSVSAAEQAQQHAATQARTVFEAHPGLRDTALLLTDSSTELDASDAVGGSRPIGALAAAMRAEASTGAATGRLWWHHPCLCADAAWSAATFARKTLSAIFEVAAMASYNCGSQLEHMGRLEAASKAYQRGQTASALRLGLDHQLTKRLRAAAADVDRQLKPTTVAEDDDDLDLDDSTPEEDVAPPLSTVAPRHTIRQSHEGLPQHPTSQPHRHGGPLAASLTPRTRKPNIRRPSPPQQHRRPVSTRGLDATAMSETRLDAAYVPDARFQASPEPRDSTASTGMKGATAHSESAAEKEAAPGFPEPEAMAAAMARQPGSAGRVRARDWPRKTGSKPRRVGESREHLGAGLKAYLDPPALPSLPTGEKGAFGGEWRPKGPRGGVSRPGTTKGHLFVGAGVQGSSNHRITTARQRQRQQQQQRQRRHEPLTARETGVSGRALASARAEAHRRPASAPRGSRGDSDHHVWLPAASSRQSRGVPGGGGGGGGRARSTARLTDSEMALAGPFVIAEPAMAIPSIGGDGLRPSSARRGSTSTGRLAGQVRRPTAEQLSPLQEQAYAAPHEGVVGDDNRGDEAEVYGRMAVTVDAGHYHPQPPALPQSGLFYASNLTSEPRLSARRARTGFGFRGRGGAAHSSTPAYDSQQNASAVTRAVRRAEQRGTQVPPWARAIAEAEAAKEAEMQVFTTMQNAAADLRKSLGLSTLPHGSSRPDFAPHARETTSSQTFAESHRSAPVAAVSNSRMTRAQAELDTMLGPDVTARGDDDDAYAEDTTHAGAPVTPTRRGESPGFVVSGQPEGVIEPVPLQTLSPMTPGTFLPAGPSQD
jgi:hypothetical protein